MGQLARWLFFGLILLGVAAPSLLRASGPEAAAGKTIFAKKCARCHGKAGEGKAAIARMFKVEMRHLGAKQVQAKSDAELRQDITQGTGKMKPVKGLSEADQANLVAYIRTLKQK
ncbi:MAG: c-type cytochrome [Terriglobia bacterium]